MFHIFGLNVVLGRLGRRRGRAARRAVRPDSAVEAIEKHGVTVLAGPPRCGPPGPACPTPARRAFAIGEGRHVRRGPRSSPTARTIKERFGIEVGEGYGLTEASPVVTASASTPRAGSVGAPVAGVEVRLVDADGEDVLVGDPGEIWVRGPNVFQGYWNDAEATRSGATTTAGSTPATSPWSTTRASCSWSTGRKDLIIVSGFNVFPAEVEEVLVQAHGVRERAPWSACPTRTPARRSRPSSSSRPGSP